MIQKSCRKQRRSREKVREKSRVFISGLGYVNPDNEFSDLDRILLRLNFSTWNCPMGISIKNKHIYIYIYNY